MKRIADPEVCLLQAAADSTRLAILRQLSADGPTCACDLGACCTGLSQSTVSHHLKVLREAGWIEGQRRGTWIWYRIREEAVARFAALSGSIRPGASQPAASFRPPTDQARTLKVVQPDWREW